MASTYSTNLRLENIATGEQSGTWGDSTDNNICTLIEQAISGVAAVAQGDVADKTLTALNGAADESRNAVISITGALTAARNVVVPTADKLYIFSNDTTGGFNITVKTTAGTGVAIPPGQKMWVYCDATNVVNGQNAFSAAIGWQTFTDAGATGAEMRLFHDSSSPAASDIVARYSAYGRDSAANQQSYGSLFWTVTDATSASEDSTFGLQIAVAGTVTTKLTMSNTALSPGANDGLALGVAGTGYSDLFFAIGAVINYNSSNFTVTHSTDTLTFANVGTSIAINGSGLVFNNHNSATIGSSSVNTTLPFTGAILYTFDNAVTVSGIATSTTGVSVGTYSSTGATAGVDIRESGAAARWRSSVTVTSAFSHASFANPNGVVGSISTSASATAFNTSSDATLKDDDGEMPMELAEQVIDAVRIHDFRWKTDGVADQGVFAQELFEVYPSAVTPGGWFSIETGEPGIEHDENVEYRPWAVDYSKLVTPMLRTLQSVLSRLAVLENGGAN